MSKTREEIKRDNRRWFVIRLSVFLVAAAVFTLLMVGVGYLADYAAPEYRVAAAVSTKGVML